MTRASSDSQRGRPSGWSSRARTLLEIATWVCRSGSPARESRWSNAAARNPRVSICASPGVADPGERGLAFEPGQRVRDRLVVGGLDLFAGRGRAEGPQQGDALDRGEDQVVAGDRATVTTGLLGLDPRPFAARRGPPVLVGEPGDAGGDALGSRGQRRVRSGRRGRAWPRVRASAWVRPAASSRAMICSASGCMPLPNRARIWSSRTRPSTARSAAPAPIQRPGGLPEAV